LWLLLSIHNQSLERQEVDTTSIENLEPLCSKGQATTLFIVWLCDLLRDPKLTLAQASGNTESWWCCHNFPYFLPTPSLTDNCHVYAIGDLAKEMCGNLRWNICCTPKSDHMQCKKETMQDLKIVAVLPLVLIQLFYKFLKLVKTRRLCWKWLFINCTSLK